LPGQQGITVGATGLRAKALQRAKAGRSPLEPLKVVQFLRALKEFQTLFTMMKAPVVFPPGLLYFETKSLKILKELFNSAIS
jgi:hypothetical protein